MMYSQDTETIFNAFTKAYESALTNYEAASVLSKSNHTSQATSLAILSLEEVGKMMLIDGLLFAKTGDERYKLYKQGHLSHRMKLAALEFYPFLLIYLKTIDPRRNEDRYERVMNIIFIDLKAKLKEVSNVFGGSFVFHDLDQLKQQGFYSHEIGGALKANKDAIDTKVAKAILDLTWRVTDSLKFVLGRSLEHYKISVKEIRDKMDEVGLKQIRKEATKIVEKIFSFDPD